MLGICILIFGACSSMAWNSQMENPNLFEGDMVLSEEQKQEIKKGEINPGLPLAARKTRHWPKIIAYEIADSLSSIPKAVAAINDAIADYEKLTCLRFKKRTTETPGDGYLHFFKAGGCWSHVGKHRGVANKISLGTGCWSKYAALHEIAHALGFYHEQSRPDRDDYVTIRWDNIPDSQKHNFAKAKSEDIDSLNVPYDYRSIMHYSGKAFGLSRLTIKTKDPAMQNVIGRTNKLSELDIKQMNLLYNCNGATARPPSTQGPATKPVKTSPPACSDRGADCRNWMKMCRSSSGSFWGKYVRENCRRSCGFCK